MSSKNTPHTTARQTSARAAGNAIEFGELRSLLQRPPGEELWRVLTSVLRLMELGDPTTFEEQILPYVERALERWPDELRVMTQHWSELAQQGKLPPRCPQLVRTLTTPLYQHSDAIIHTFLEHPALEHVTHIQIGHLQRPRALAALLTSPRSRSLHTISIGSMVWHYDQASMEEGLVGLREPLMARPRVFRCSYASINDDLLRALAAQPLFEQLEHLDLSNSHGFSPDGISALLSSPHLRHLRTLKLESCQLDASAARAIQDMPLEHASLVELNLSKNRLDADAASALANAPMLANLRSLDLSYNNGIGEGAAALFTSGHLSQLEHLDLTSTSARDATVAALLDPQQRLQSLHTLLLGYCQLGPEAARSIAHARLPALTTLRLHNNELDDEGLAALHTLDLRANALRPAAARAFAHTRAFPALRALELGYNTIGDGGATAIAASSLLSRLEALDLEHNNISLTGAGALLTSTNIGNLKRLKLANNPIPAAHRLAGFVEGLVLEV
jgi:hypothetical protein